MIPIDDVSGGRRAADRGAPSHETSGRLRQRRKLVVVGGLETGEKHQESEGGVSARVLACESNVTALVDGAATGRAAKSSTGVVLLPEQGVITR